MRVGGYLYLYAGKWLHTKPDDTGFYAIVFEDGLPWLVRQRIRFLRWGKR